MENVCAGGMDAQREFLLGNSNASAVGTTAVVHADRLASEANHRLYRQHRGYNVRLSLLTNTVASLAQPVEVWALAPNWKVIKALQVAKQMYDEATVEELLTSGKSRWHDFRITMDVTADVLEGYGKNAAGVAGASYNPFVAGEYDFSTITDQAGSNLDFHLVANTNAFGYNVFEEFDQMGRASPDPVSTVPPGGYGGLLPGLDQNDLTELLEEGNNPPYDSQNNPRNGAWVQIAELYRDPSGHVLSTGYFDAPLGIIVVRHAHTIEQNVPFLRLEYAAGSYKGIKSSPLGA